MTSRTKINIIDTLQRVHAAQAIAAKTEDAACRQRIDDAVNLAISIIVIYLKLGPTPTIQEKHRQGLSWASEVFDDVLLADSALT
ncbi:hypothetical protein [Paraburkholderia unamae]|uniref:Uncharacterized protein n=1 Tax=Paraburkholderia unamae TaxID=219649 RepID=A0ACC6RGJ3_9BURK